MLRQQKKYLKHLRRYSVYEYNIKKFIHNYINFYFLFFIFYFLFFLFFLFFYFLFFIFYFLFFIFYLFFYFILFFFIYFIFFILFIYFLVNLCKLFQNLLSISRIIFGQTNNLVDSLRFRITTLLPITRAMTDINITFFCA